MTRVSGVEHRTFASKVLTHIGEHMGIRQATSMASFIQSHPAFQRTETGKGKSSGVMDEINEFQWLTPLHPLREMFEREQKQKEAASMQAAGEELVRNYGESGAEGQPSAVVEKTYRY